MYGDWIGAKGQDQTSLFVTCVKQAVNKTAFMQGRCAPVFQQVCDFSGAQSEEVDRLFEEKLGDKGFRFKVRVEIT